MLPYHCSRHNGGARERGRPRRAGHDSDAGDHRGGHQRQPEAAVSARPRLCILLPMTYFTGLDRLLPQRSTLRSNLDIFRLIREGKKGLGGYCRKRKTTYSRSSITVANTKQAHFS